MSMSVTLRQIVDARDALMNLSTLKLPIKLAYNISKIIRKVNSELSDLTKIRQDIISNHLKEGETVTPEINEAITSELNIVLERVVEIPVNRVDLSGVNIDITVRDITQLDPFCIFETVELK